MGRSRAVTTALTRRCEREARERIAAEYAARLERARTGVRERRAIEWAVDRLVRDGLVDADTGRAARDYASAIDRSQPGGGGNRPKVDGGDSDPHARLWDASQSAYVARTARSWIWLVGGERQKTMPVLDALFAFDGRRSTGPRPNLVMMREAMDVHHATCERRIIATLGQLAEAMKFVKAHPFAARMRLPDAKALIFAAQTFRPRAVEMAA